MYNFQSVYYFALYDKTIANYCVRYWQVSGVTSMSGPGSEILVPRTELGHLHAGARSQKWRKTPFYSCPGVIFILVP